MSTGNDSRVPWWQKWWGKLGIGSALGTIIVERLWSWLIQKSVYGTLWREFIQFCDWLAQDMPVPLWLLAGVILLGLSAVGALVVTVCKLLRAKARIVQLLNPPIEILDDEEHMVIMAIADHLNNTQYPTEEDLRDYLDFQPLKVRRTVGWLTKKKLVEEGRLNDLSTFVDLTDTGLEYTTRPESYARSKQMAFVDDGRAEIAE